MDLYIVKRDFVLSERKYLKGDVIILNNEHICFLFNLTNKHLKLETEYGFYKQLFERESYISDDYEKYNGKYLHFCTDSHTNLRFLYYSRQHIRNFCFVKHLDICMFNELVEKYNINILLSNEEKDNRFKKVIRTMLGCNNMENIKLLEWLYIMKDLYNSELIEKKQ